MSAQDIFNNDLNEYGQFVKVESETFDFIGYFYNSEKPVITWYFSDVNKVLRRIDQQTGKTLNEWKNETINVPSFNFDKWFEIYKDELK